MQFGDGADLIRLAEVHEAPPTTIEVCIEDDAAGKPLALTADCRAGPLSPAKRAPMVSMGVQTEVLGLTPRTAGGAGGAPSPFSGLSGMPFNPAAPPGAARGRRGAAEEAALVQSLEHRLDDASLLPRPALKPVRTSSPDPSVSNGRRPGAAGAAPGGRGAGAGAGVGAGVGAAGAGAGAAGAGAGAGAAGAGAGAAGAGAGAAAAAAAPAPLPGPLEPRAITRRIERCTDLQELEEFVAAHGATFNQVRRAAPGCSGPPEWRLVGGGALGTVSARRAQRIPLRLPHAHYRARPQIHVSLALLQLHRIAEREKSAAAVKSPSPAPPAPRAPAPQQPGRPAAGAGEAADELEDYGEWRRSQPPSPRGAAHTTQLEWDQMQVEADAQFQRQQEQQRGGRAATREPSGAGYSAPLRGGGGGGGGAMRANPLYRASSLQSSLPPVSPSARSSSAMRRHIKVLRRVAGLPSDASKLLWFGKPKILLYVSARPTPTQPLASCLASWLQCNMCSCLAA
jgi:hypothetical protein